MRRYKHGRRILTCSYLVLGAMLCALADPTQAAFITVNSPDDEFNDDGDCSLLEAVESANDNVGYDQCTSGSAIGTDAIFVAVNGTIAMTNSLTISERVEIFGLGKNATVLDVGGITLHFLVVMPDDSHDFELSGMTLRNGRDFVPGGSIWVQRSGDLRFENMRFEANRGSTGGALATSLPRDDEITLEIIDVEFVDNIATSNGGALWINGYPTNEPPVSILIERSLFEDNQAAGRGGALFLDDTGGVQIESSVFRNNETINGPSSSETGGAIDWGNFQGSTNLLSIRGSTFQQNTSHSSGGAIAQTNGILFVVNSTFAGNFARGPTGNALYLRSDAVAGIYHSTLVDHGSSNRRFDHTIGLSDASTLALDHTVIWNPLSGGGDDCDVDAPTASLTSLGHNFDTDGSCTSQGTDRSGVDPMFWPLGDYGDGVNGRILETLLPRPQSPLIDGGQAGPCTAVFGAALGTDARGVTRPLNGDGSGGAQCDPGAVEFDANADPVGRVVNVVVIGNRGGTVTSVPAGINCPGNCGEFFIDGGTVDLMATPEPGFVFIGWGGDCGGDDSCQLVMNTNRDVSARFERPAEEVFADGFEGPTP